MSQQNSFFNFHGAIVKCLEATIDSFTKTFTGARVSGRQPKAEPGNSPAPTTQGAGNAAARPADPGAGAAPVHPAPQAKDAPVEPSISSVAAVASTARSVVESAPASAAPPLPRPVRISRAAPGAEAQRSAAACAPVTERPAPVASAVQAAADPALDALRARIAAMETRVVDLETRKAGMEQILEEYAYCQYRALGELLDEQLRLQKEVLRRVAERSFRAADRAAADAAAEEYAAYRQARQQPAAPPAALDEGESSELTALYRTVVMRCHPDRVGEAEKAQAHETFLRTQEAYRRRDLETMRLISRQLAADAMPSPISDGSTPRGRLEALLETLLDKGTGLLMAIQSLQAEPNYRRACRREQWEAHFAAIRERLEEECLALRRQL